MTWVYIFTGIFVLSWILQLIFSPKRAAKNIAETGEKLYSDLHQYAPVDAKQFRDLDLAFYDRTQAELEILGFRHVGDYEDVTLSRQMPSMRTFIRRMISSDGTVMAGTYHLKYRGFMRLLALFGILPGKPFYLDLETEFSNGSFLATSNTDTGANASPFPGITNQLHPQWMTPSDLLADHRKGMAAVEQQGHSAVKLATASEYQASQDRMQELKNRHRKSQGFIDLELSKTVARNQGNSDASDEMIAELTALQRQRSTITPMTPPPLPPTKSSEQAAA
jgi:hypothetical protein